jgi:hypothetical protein
LSAGPNLEAPGALEFAGHNPLQPQNWVSYLLPFPSLAGFDGANKFI